MREAWVRSLGWQDPLEKGTATHAGVVAWRIPWTERPGRLQSVGSQSRTWLRDIHFHINQDTKGGISIWALAVQPCRAYCAGLNDVPVKTRVHLYINLGLLTILQQFRIREMYIYYVHLEFQNFKGHFHEYSVRILAFNLIKNNWNLMFS